jgi:pimeloyl-ACP methyl ester carboxylesterase
VRSIVSGRGADGDWSAIAPFYYGRWDAAAQAYEAGHGPQRNDEAAAVFAADGAFDPEATRAALAKFTAPVLLVAGEVDLNSVPGAVKEFAGLFPDADLVVQPGAGHFPWLDDPATFVTTTAASGRARVTAHSPRSDSLTFLPPHPARSTPATTTTT